MLNSDLVTFELWDEELFTVTKNQPKSAINIAEVYWQGLDSNCYFQIEELEELRQLYKGPVRESNDKKANLLMSTVLFAKQLRLQVQAQVHVISTVVMVYLASSRNRVKK